MAALCSMSIMELKAELIELNDSSFVFNQRDELECALRSARKFVNSKRAAGLESKIESQVLSSTTATSATSPAASAAAGETLRRLSSSNISSSSDAAVEDPESCTDGGGRDARQKASSIAAAKEVEPWTAGGPAPPDMVSVSSESNTSSMSPPPSRRGPSGKGVALPPPIVEREAEQQPPRRRSSAVDIFDDQPTEAPDMNSRRLVEYFVMVSCVPIEEVDDLAARVRKNLTWSHPPDPSRDKMNSRTRARFDVRRVHLSNSVNSTDSTLPIDSVEGDGEHHIAMTLLEPKITARYPAKDHSDQPLNLRLPQFCFPEGTELIRPTTDYRMPRVHHFVLTDSLGGKQHGTALTVFEEFNPQKEGEESYKKKRAIYYAPRVVVLLSTYPYLHAFRTYLTQLYRLATTTDCMTAPIERYVQNICSEVPAPPPGAFEVQLSILGSNIRFWAPPANQPIPYVSLPFKLLFECLDIGNILFAWYTLACERKVLLVSSQLSLLVKCSEILCSLLFPMRWSHLYIPLLPRSLSPMLDAPMPYLCGISRENFPYAVEDISDETVVVDLDRNVITLGPNTPDLPPLPHNRRKKLEAALKANAGEVFWEARNLTKADVLRVRASGDEGTLSSILDKAGAVWEERMRTRDDAFNLAHAPGSVSLQFDEDANADLDNEELPKQSRWDAVQEAFLRFYVSLLQDYRSFLPENRNLEERSSWRGKEGLSSLRYKKEEFVAASPSEFQPFLEELTLTQQFDDFVTCKMHNANDAADIKFFDQSIDAKRNRSKLKLKKKETPFLHSASAHRDLKRVMAVEPSTEGLPPQVNGELVYMYKTWPLTFNEKLFGTPRPIPSIISAEFDRRTALRAMLRSKYGIVDDDVRVRDRLGGRNRTAEGTAFVLFFATFTSVIGKELAIVERKHGSGSLDGAEDFGGPLFPSHPGSTKKLKDMDDDMEAARHIAKAQVDLGYHALSLMRARKLPPEPMAYKLLIQACGRCRVTHRASGLMEMLARDGLATNSEIYTSLITAFSNDEGQPSSLALYQMQEDNMSSLSASDRGSATTGGSTTHLLLDRRISSGTSEHSLDLISEGTLSEQGSSATGTSLKKGRMARLTVSKQMFKGIGAKSKRKVGSPAASLSRKQNLKVTAAVAKQIELGESLLESLYPSLEIDTENVCPKCASVLDEDSICLGWMPCDSNEYRTECPSCHTKFVPKFSVSCGSPTFEGSQGRGTPLYCDLLSPWVLLREIRGVIVSEGGIDSMLEEKFRKGPDISATLWWNMVVTFRRYRLPYIFLLQGSFQNQLILPSPSLNESMNDIS